MAGTDVTSSLPVRTNANGDVVVFLADGNTSTQLTAVDVHGSLSSILRDTSGNAIGDQELSASYWLQIVSPSNGAVSGGAAASYSDLVGGVYNSPALTLTAGQQASLQLDAAGNLNVNLQTELPAGTNNIGSVNQGTSPWITKDDADGPVTPGTVASNSILIGAQYNSSLPTLTTGQQAALQADSSGRLIVSPLTTASVIKVDLQDGSGNAISSQTIDAAQWLDVVEPYNGATGSAVPADAAYVAGINGSGDLQGISVDDSGNVNSNVFVGGSPNSNTNPVYVILTNSTPGNAVNYYNATGTIAVNASDETSVYTITSGKTLTVKKVWFSSSVRMRADFQTSPDGSTYTTIFSAFNSSAEPNGSFDTDELSIADSGSGSTVRVVLTNDDVKVASGYVTILGTEN